LDIETKAAQEREELWAESVRRYNARQQQDHRLAWYEYEMRLFRIHSGLASEHPENAEKYRENGNHEEGREQAKTTHG
jgi:hypothetical protein